MLSLSLCLCLSLSLSLALSLSLLLQSGGNEALLEGKEERTGENDKDVWGIQKKNLCFLKTPYTDSYFYIKVNAFFLVDKVR